MDGGSNSETAPLFQWSDSEGHREIEEILGSPIPIQNKDKVSVVHSTSNATASLAHFAKFSTKMRIRIIIISFVSSLLASISGMINYTLF